MIPKILPEANLTPKLPKSIEVEVKKRSLVAEVNQKFAKNATLSVLAEAESMVGYKREQLALSFETLNYYIKTYYYLTKRQYNSCLFNISHMFLLLCW